MFFWFIIKSSLYWNLQEFTFYFIKNSCFPLKASFTIFFHVTSICPTFLPPSGPRGVCISSRWSALEWRTGSCPYCGRAVLRTCQSDSSTLPGLMATASGRTGSPASPTWKDEVKRSLQSGCEINDTLALLSYFVDLA